MNWTRRSFIQKCGAAGLVSIGATPPLLCSRMLQAAYLNDAPAVNRQRVLVLIELAGGNDGLNTVVPFADDAYYRARPGIAIPRDQVLKLDDYCGLHPALDGLKALFDAGQLSVLNGIGYPQPDRSHFRSMDIWHSAISERDDTREGWLGKALQSVAASRQSTVPGMSLGTQRLPLALVSRELSLPSIRDAAAFSELNRPGTPASQELIKSLLRESHVTKSGRLDSELDFIRATAGTSDAMLQRLQTITAGGAGSLASYPDNGLGQQLKVVSQLIAGELGVKVFFLSLGGFDTHARQKPAHDGLLRQLSTAVAAFYKDLADRKLADRVLTATFSEFGRRVDENGSLGTDHGAASQMFVAGPVATPGVIGKHPSLTDLGEGDLKFHTDFRSVYATLLRNWLQVPAEHVLPGEFATLNFV